MTGRPSIGSDTIAYDLIGEGRLVILGHGIGESRQSYRFALPRRFLAKTRPHA